MCETDSLRGLAVRPGELTARLREDLEGWDAGRGDSGVHEGRGTCVRLRPIHVSEHFCHSRSQSNIVKQLSSTKNKLLKNGTTRIPSNSLVQ